MYIYILEKCILLNGTKWRLNGIEWWLVTKWHWIVSEWLRKCTCHLVACHSVVWMVPARFQRKVAFCLSLFKGSRLTSLKKQYNFNVYQQRIVTFFLTSVIVNSFWASSWSFRQNKYRGLRKRKGVFYMFLFIKYELLHRRSTFAKSIFFFNDNNKISWIRLSPKSVTIILFIVKGY